MTRRGRSKLTGKRLQYFYLPKKSMKIGYKNGVNSAHVVCLLKVPNDDDFWYKKILPPIFKLHFHPQVSYHDIMLVPKKIRFSNCTKKIRGTSKKDMGKHMCKIGIGVGGYIILSRKDRATIFAQCGIGYPHSIS